MNEEYDLYNLDDIYHSDESLKKQAAMWGTRMNSNSTITSSNRYSFHNAEDLNENYDHQIFITLI